MLALRLAAEGSNSELRSEIVPVQETTALSSPTLAEVAPIQENQEPRRQGKPKRRHRWTDRVPVDEIAPQHQEIDGWLKQWGRWNFTRKERSSLASIEGLYEGSYRTAKATGAAEMVDLKSIEIERAVLRMPKQQRDTLRMFYVQQKCGHYICQVFHLRYEAYQGWMNLCRVMVLNLLRYHESGPTRGRVFTR